MRDIVRFQIDSLKETLRLQERIQWLLRRGLVSLLRDSVGDTTPVTFNDETGLPAFRDFSEGEFPVVAVRVGIVNGERVLQINNSCGDDEYGLDPDELEEYRRREFVIVEKCGEYAHICDDVSEAQVPYSELLLEEA